MNYFTSDIHFSDWNTIFNDKRPFNSPKAHDKFIIKTWNKTMTREDTLYIVGDLFDCDGPKSEIWKQCIGYFKKVRPKIILIMGNNEDRIVKYFFNNNFELFREFCLSIGIADVRENDYISFGGYEFYLTHKPMNHKKGYENLTGHVHRSRGLWYSFGLNVSCILNYFKPHSEEDILYTLNERSKYYHQQQFKLY